MKQTLSLAYFLSVSSFCYLIRRCAKDRLFQLSDAKLGVMTATGSTATGSTATIAILSRPLQQVVLRWHSTGAFLSNFFLLWKDSQKFLLACFLTHALRRSSFFSCVQQFMLLFVFLVLPRSFLLLVMQDPAASCEGYRSHEAVILFSRAQQTDEQR